MMSRKNNNIGKIHKNNNISGNEFVTLQKE